MSYAAVLSTPRRSVNEVSPVKYPATQTLFTHVSPYIAELAAEFIDAGIAQCDRPMQ